MNAIVDGYMLALAAGSAWPYVFTALAILAVVALVVAAWPR